MEFFFFDVGDAFVLEVDEKHFLYAVFPFLHQLLYVLVEHIGLSGTSDADKYIVGVFLDNRWAWQQCYPADKFLLPQDNLLDDVFFHISVCLIGQI